LIVNIALQAEIEAQLAGMHHLREQLARNDHSPAMRSLLSDQLAADIEWLRGKVLPPKRAESGPVAKPALRLVTR
jgi:hypothetical protein